jgi:hypothetical protein
MTIEFRNMTGKCLDKRSDNPVVLHEVGFEWNDGTDGWHPDTQIVMATDPMNAIATVRSKYK